MNQSVKMQRYHQDYVSQRRVERVIASSPAAIEIEKKALKRERQGQYRIAARLWLECLDVAVGEVERAKIAIRRDQCITKSNGLRRGDYSGIRATCGVIYD